MPGRIAPAPFWRYAEERDRERVLVLESAAVRNLERQHEPIPEAAADALAAKIRGAREIKGWSRERLSVEAENSLRIAAADFMTPIFVTTEERQIWREIEISSRCIELMERRPVLPLGRGDRRARLRGVCLALGLDFAEVNRIAGGL